MCPRKSINNLVQVYCKFFSNYLVLKQSFSYLFFIVMQLTAFRLGARWQLRVQCSTFGLRCCQHDRFGLARNQWETASFFKCLLIDFPSRMYCLLLLWISLERCFQCGLPKSNLVLFKLRVGELGALWRLVLPLRNAGVHQVWLRWL